MTRGTTLLLVRHGQTSGNLGGLDAGMSGWTDVPLTRTGLAEAQAAAEWLSTEGPLPVLYASPLQRALCTARVIARRCHTELRVEPGLKEIHCGEADGLPIREVMSRFPRHWAQNLAQDDPAFCWPGGESYADFRRRAVSAVARIAEAHAGERVVLVTHAGVITQILGWIEGGSPARWDQRRARNGSITELAWDGGRARLVRFDQIGAVTTSSASTYSSSSSSSCSSSSS